jgi:hypothetical protein
MTHVCREKEIPSIPMCSFSVVVSNIYVRAWIRGELVGQQVVMTAWKKNVLLAYESFLVYKLSFDCRYLPYYIYKDIY